MHRALLCVLFTLLVCTPIAQAAVPQAISYQGILREADGAVVADGDYSLSFKLYNVAGGGTPLWTETQTLAVADGVFNALLGSVTPLGLDFSGPYWLGVAVGGGAELTPRIPLAATPYSLNADRLDGLSGENFASSGHTHLLDALSDVDAPAPGAGQVLTFSGTAWTAQTPAAGDDGDWAISGGDIYRLDGRVGIGSTPGKRAGAKDERATRDGTLAKLQVYATTPDAEGGLYAALSDFDDGDDGRAGVFALRSSYLLNPGLGYGVGQTNDAVLGYNVYGDPYSFGVAGYTWFDGPRTGGVLGASYDASQWGALGYSDASAVGWGVYTPGNSYTGGTATLGGFKLSTGAAPGKVLTADASGVGTWQDPAPDGQWTASGDNLYRTLGKVGIGTAPSVRAAPAEKDAGREGRDATDARLQVYAATPDLQGGLWARLEDYDNLSDTRAAVYATRSSSLLNPGSHVGIGGTNNAITGWNSWGDPYSFGVAGYTYFDSPNTGGVLGGNQGTDMWGALAFRDGASANWGVYTPYNSYTGGTATLGGFKLAAGAAAGRVLTADANGVGTWQAPIITGSGTANTLARWTAANTLAGSALYQQGMSIGIGTTGPEAALEVNNASGSAIIGQVTAVGTSDHIGVEGYSVPADGWGIGGKFTGGFYGVFTRVLANGADYYYGLYSYAANGTGGYRYGAWCAAHGPGTNYGVYGVAYGGSTNWAGYFGGNVHVTGTLSKAAGSFTIDHPLDPTGKTLSHSFVESPDMKNVYDGTVVLGANGSAWVEMPEWFEALNRDFRYQLTCIGGFAPVYVATKIAGNRFQIAGGTAGLEVSWQVTGIRQDAYANAHRIPVEELKSEKALGRYLNPEAFGQPESMGVGYEEQRAARGGEDR